MYDGEQHRGAKGEGTLGDAFSLPESFSVEELEHYLVCTIHSTTLDRQLQSIPREDARRNMTEGRKPSNMKKNRYKNNTPYDDTRVVLQDQQTDYINASYIEGNGGTRDFIATQGPKESNDRTIDDFWRMIWQNNTNVIVMLGNLVEGGLGKVSQYWPQDIEVTESYGQMKVEKKFEKKEVDYIRRHFLVTLDIHTREMVQYQFIGWPDHNVPGSPVGAAHMIKDMLRWRRTGPPVIHCSAGLGRTGTLLLVLRLLDDLRTKGHFHSLNTLRSLRKCRANLLDNQHQYRFAHHVLLEILFGEKTRSPLDKFSAHLASVRQQLPDQYKKLKSFPISFTFDWARSHDLALNRDKSVLPPDGRHFPLVMKDNNSAYVNVVRVRGANLRDTFLVAEHPMAHTISRYWKLAYMTGASAWVFLHDHKPNNEEFPSVLPSNGYGELEGITVKVTGKAEKQFFTEYSITVSQSESHKMRLIQLKNWNPTKDLPSPPQSLIFLAEHIQEIRQSLPLRVIMISCSDGYSGSGLFVSLARMVAELSLIQQVDVYRTVQSVLFDRSQFITSLRQYFYLHDAILVYAKLQKVKQNKVRQQAKQTNTIETDELGHEKEKKKQLMGENERNSENYARERSKTESEKDLKAAQSLQKARSIAVYKERETKENREINGNRRRENIGKENKGIKGQDVEEITQNESGRKMFEEYKQPYSKLWNAS